MAIDSNDFEAVVNELLGDGTSDPGADSGHKSNFVNPTFHGFNWEVPGVLQSFETESRLMLSTEMFRPFIRLAEKARAFTPSIPQGLFDSKLILLLREFYWYQCYT